MKSDLDNLKLKYARVVDDRDEAFAKIEYLESEKVKNAIKLENDEAIEAIKALQHEVEKLNFENKTFKETIANKNEEIS